MRPVNQRTAGQMQAIQAGLDGLNNDLRVAIPGIITKWNKVDQTVEVQPAVMEHLTQNSVESDVALPILVDVPVVMPRAGGYSLVFAPKPGDPCLVVFADSCIDSWWQSGSVQPQADIRRHDLSDGFAILGCWPKTNQPKIPDTGVRLQNDEGTAGVYINGGSVNIFGTVSINGVPFTAHQHSGGEKGTGTTGGVVSE